ncbi:MAG: hypothetical protein M3N23_08330, partial [Pseudomonadota bacterium]|nr:hypothetical protein [Pseudomonadota bacterium]
MSTLRTCIAGVTLAGLTLLTSACKTDAVPAPVAAANVPASELTSTASGLKFKDFKVGLARKLQPVPTSPCTTRAG